MQHGTLRKLKVQIVPQLITCLENMVQGCVLAAEPSEESRLLLESYFDMLTASVCFDNSERFVEDKKNLLFNIILPCLVPTDSVNRLLADNPSEYLNRRADLCHKCLS